MPSIYTPRDLQIEKRHLKFGREIKPTRWWHSGDPGRTAFFNALSSTFPVGKKFFMAAVRHYRDGTPEPLRSQIDDFLYQESMHSREHAAFNRQAQDVGYWPQLDGQRRWLNSAIMVQEMRVFGVRRAIENLHSLQRDNARPFEFFA